jgi:azurin
VALVDAIAYIVDPALRAQFQPLLASALTDAGTSPELRKAALRALPLMGAQNAGANFATLATALREGKDRTTAARAVMQLPRESWNKEAAEPITQAILTWAQTVPADHRTEQSFVETMQAGREMASLLSPEEAARVRKELRGLSVDVFVIKTVREQMRYDTPRIAVEPGKQFEVIFENVDAMPHNIVFVKPGTREQVGMQANTQAPTSLDEKGRAYVPKNNKNILAASRLLEPGQKETLKIKAPTQPGEYEFLCTFPGHWPVMWGKMIVTKDPEGALKQAEAAPGAGSAPVAAAHVHAQ